MRFKRRDWAGIIFEIIPLLCWVAVPVGLGKIKRYALRLKNGFKALVALIALRGFVAVLYWKMYCVYMRCDGSPMSMEMPEDQEADDEGRQGGLLEQRADWVDEENGPEN